MYIFIYICVRIYIYIETERERVPGVVGLGASAGGVSGQIRAQVRRVLQPQRVHLERLVIYCQTIGVRIFRMDSNSTSYRAPGIKERIPAGLRTGLYTRGRANIMAAFVSVLESFIKTRQ